jgi:putative selenium metabolism protein SsnA
MLITNGKIITWEEENRILEGHAIFIEGELIKEIGKADEMRLKYKETEIIDVQGQFIIPGNICAHTHFYGAFARGLAIPGKAPKDFPEILQKLWWPLDLALTKEDVKYSALVCLIDAIKHGTTTLFDHHASSNFISGSLDEIASSVIEAGVRSVVCYEVTDRNGSLKSEEGIWENIRFINLLKSNPSYKGKLAAMFGIHASLTVSDKTLALCRENIPSGIGIHIHVAEHPVDEYDSLIKSGTRVVDRLNNFQLLGPKSIAAHAVHVDAREIEILSDTKTWVSHQPRSNMNNGVGLADIESMLRAGVKVCLGNDGFSNAMWEEWKMVYLVHKLKHLDPQRMNGNDVIKIAVKNCAKLTSTFFEGNRMGVIQEGARADIIFVDYHNFTPLTAGNLAWHILFGFNDSMVTNTIVGGKFLMRNRELLTLDEEKITYEARKLAENVWKRYSEFVK